MDNSNGNALSRRKLRFRGRAAQVPIYLGKLLRSFAYQNDWKVLPMSAIIAALVSMVVRNDFFVTMEGTLKGALALSCVSIWNGCFNSIQSVCRERNIIKREHRSGMHISSYVAAHMIYQFLLCMAQTVITVYVCRAMGIRFPVLGFMTPLMVVDIGITVFLVTYASDMLSLLISSVSRTTTAAMTVMPFILIFQLIFSGGIFSLPSWASGISDYTVSNYGLRCIAAQADYNNLPMVTAWNTLNKIKNDEIVYTTTVGELADALGARAAEGLMAAETEAVSAPETPAAEVPAAEAPAETQELLTEEDLVKALENASQLADALLTDEVRAREINLTFTLQQVMDVIGEDTVKEAVQRRTAAATARPVYERTASNISSCWMRLVFFAMVFAVLTVISLEFIDKDRR